MTHHEQITAVTEDLRKAMSEAQQVIRLHDAATGRAASDQDHYTAVAQLLEAFVLAVLNATSAQPLLGMRPAGARFDCGAGTELSGAVSRAVLYLRDTASVLISTDNFSRYEGQNTKDAVNHLKGLYGLLRTSIVTQARKDLAQVADRNVSLLCDLADDLSAAARKIAPTAAF